MAPVISAAISTRIDAAAAIRTPVKIVGAAAEQGRSLSDLARLDTMVTVVDGVNFLRDFHEADSLASRGETLGEEDERSITDLLIEQVEFADVILISKIDLISQAEHDPLAASVLITDSEDLLRDVQAAIEAQVPGAFHEDQIREALTGPQSGVLLVRDMDQAVEVSDRYATEHLEIQTRDPEALVGRIRNAGAVFVGPHAPVPLGDYSAGSNHVLPTSGSARHSSGLSTHTFMKSIHVVNYSKDALCDVSQTVIALADAERLPAHGEAIAARFNN